MKVFVFDPTCCNGCYACQLACKDETVGNDWSPYSKPQPDTGQFWCGLEEIVHGQQPKVKVEYRLHMNAHSDAFLEKAGDAAYRTEEGFVILDPEKSKGRRDLVDERPGGVWWNEELQIPQKCTGCQHLVEEGELPHCVDHCPTGALSFGESDEVDLANAVPAEEGGIFYYKNLPGLFIAGDVWDPVPNEVVEGAKVELKAAENERTIAETVTDGFGDFWFRKLEPGEYHVVVRADGYEPMERDVYLDKSLNIGDFPLEPEVEDDEDEEQEEAA